jgi:hypothetical protein
MLFLDQIRVELVSARAEPLDAPRPAHRLSAQ